MVNSVDYHSDTVEGYPNFIIFIQAMTVNKYKQCFSVMSVHIWDEAQEEIYNQAFTIK